MMRGKYPSNLVKAFKQYQVTDPDNALNDNPGEKLSEKQVSNSSLRTATSETCQCHLFMSCLLTLTRVVQCYTLMVMDDGGTDLESHIFYDEQEALSVLRQIVMALAHAEVRVVNYKAEGTSDAVLQETLDFEHRDLHWGNILVCFASHNSNLSCTTLLLSRGSLR